VGEARKYGYYTLCTIEITGGVLGLEISAGHGRHKAKSKSLVMVEEDVGSGRGAAARHSAVLLTLFTLVAKVSRNIRSFYPFLSFTMLLVRQGGFVYAAYR
jgi:hypothetical protein